MPPPPPPNDAAVAAPLLFPDGARPVSLPGAHRTVSVPSTSFWRKLAAFSGPGYLVAVGYMDPGNWATGIAGGSAFGYKLLSVVILSNLIAMFLQSLSAKLGIVTGLDLAQACRERYSAPVRIMLWLLCEAAIIACDIAEVIGAAIALKLLFHIPLALGVCLTGIEVLLILGLQKRGFRKLEAFIASLMIVISLCFVGELAMARPEVSAILGGLAPTTNIVTDPAMLYLAIGILGATVMPHNLYLHSAIVQTRRFDRSEAGKRDAIRFATLDVVVALTLAIFVNGAILTLAAATFHARGLMGVVGIEDAYRLLSPTLGVAAASTLFAVALLASGQNSAITGTLAGQIVMEGFTNLRWPGWARRLVSRLLAIVPAIVAVAIYGDGGATKLLIFSQVVLSLQLPFAVYPLVKLTNSAPMGPFANKGWVKVVAWSVTVLIIALNGTLLAGLL